MSSPHTPGARSSIHPDGSVFEVRGYEYGERVLRSRFRGTVNGVVVDFEEQIDFAETTSDREPQAALLRLLTLALSLSYYKATRADAIAVAFPLTAAERAYLAALIENGLGEYAFVNDAAWKLTPTIAADESAQQEGAEPERWSPHARPLVAVGGGKDSIVSIEALKATGHAPLLYSVNDRGSIRDSVAASGLDYLTIFRRIDPQLLDANRRGAPNGHVPVTAINSLIGLVAADLTESGPVVFSNEASADFGNLTWQGRTINHQWSKSLEYEDLIRSTLAAAGLSADRFFSLLRGYRELEITRDFARHPEYFDSFTSCNRAYRMSEEPGASSWCGECPKCLFVFTLLAPFVPRPRLVSIFQKDLLADTALHESLRDLLGLGAQKPFECVGEPSEAAEALVLVDRAGEWADSALLQDIMPQVPAVLPAPPRGIDRVPAGYEDARDRVGIA